MSNETNQNTIPFSLQGNYAEKVLSYYLWGTEKAPEPNQMVDEKYTNRQEDLDLLTTDEKANPKIEKVAVILQVKAQDYMDTIGFQAARVGVFQKFFNNIHDGYEKDGKMHYQAITLEEIQNAGGELSDDGKTISLNHQQLVKMIYNLGTTDGKAHYQEALQAQVAISQYTTETNEADYWQRSFVFGSTKFQVNTDEIKYVFDAQTGKALEIQNLQVTPINDNFDFVSLDGTAGRVNPVLRQKMDPSGVGRKVGIEYTENKYFDLGKFTSQDYSDYLMKYGIASGIITLPQPIDELILFPKSEPDWLEFYNGLKELDNSGVYNFLDENNRVVIFGSDKSNELNKYTTDYTYDKNNTKYIKIDQDVDLSSLGWKGAAAEWLTNAEKSKFTQYIENGIVYVAGDGDDTIIGTDYADKLIGGSGFDTYIAGDGDSIFDSDGDGQVVVNMGDSDNLEFYAYALDSTI